MCYSELQHTEAAFITGLALLRSKSLGVEFWNDKITVIVLQALTGISMPRCFGTGYSNLTLISNTAAALTLIFLEPLEQACAIGGFGGCSCVGNGQMTPTAKAKFTFTF